jgi:glycosyltransferase involved in cell wall biosynthesis
MKDSQLLVSVLIPSFNRYDLLIQAVLSIHKQAGNVSYEIVVSDDCSTNINPSQFEFLKSLKNVRFYRHPKNIGINSNYRFLAGKALGMYSLILDDDDYLKDENVFTKLAEYLCKYPEVDVIFSRVTKSFRDKSDNEFFRCELGSCSEAIISGDYVLRHWGRNTQFSESPFIIFAQGTFVRSDLVRKIDAFKEKIPASVDFYLWLMIAAKGGKFLSVPDCWVIYRVHFISVISNKFELSQCQYWADNLDCYRLILINEEISINARINMHLQIHKTLLSWQGTISNPKSCLNLSLIFLKRKIFPHYLTTFLYPHGILKFFIATNPKVYKKLRFLLRKILRNEEEIALIKTKFH